MALTQQKEQQNANESYLQESHDDAAYQNGQIELPSAESVGFREGADEEGQRPNEVNG